ncbi:hypothetical protein P175DRAFT_0531350 [Aspergillus ochraceoroseus IBT 24754]|uniref:Uncharacterized protein n=2 Tax=Aspergillus subgen. Nidulantes TaxID=2720870 RepID=A0A0F8UZG3_9EURO|nr:uncharacterized protein P175DRAFT_0531350 [Aspergillus ochraceoroseus IBT 24754]KKK16156.1 hypothetical protein ARAM_006882 [Aspergillus rambellii]PTU21818.1 hypothetical protein P175DRAFT_0531350 [Aspergillus ochraceoroseus IBT 24754]
MLQILASLAFDAEIAVFLSWPALPLAIGLCGSQSSLTSISLALCWLSLALIHILTQQSSSIDALKQLASADNFAAVSIYFMLPLRSSQCFFVYSAKSPTFHHPP